MMFLIFDDGTWFLIDPLNKIIIEIADDEISVDHKRDIVAIKNQPCFYRLIDNFSSEGNGEDLVHKIKEIKEEE